MTASGAKRAKAAKSSGAASEATAPQAAIARALKASLLPGDSPVSAAELAEASRFLIEAGRQRDPESAAILVESVTGPVGKRFTRIAVMNDNMPFLVDSMAMALTALGLTMHRLLHPVVAVARDAAGGIVSVSAAAREGATRESLVYIEADRADARTRVRLRALLETVLGDVRAAVADWPRVQAAMLADADRLEAAGEGEGAELLRWFNSGMLTQLGHVVRRRDGRHTGALGICRKSTRTLLEPANYERAFAWFDARKGPAPLIVKANRISNVHRHVPLDVIMVPVWSGDRVEALSIHAGIWTSAAMSAPPGEVPRLRARLAGVMDKFRFDPHGHDGKALVHALTKLPHDLLIAFEPAELERVATTTIGLIDRPRPHLLLVRSPLERHLFAFVWLPRDAMSTGLRLEIRSMLERATGAPVQDWSLEVEGTLALLRFTLDSRGAATDLREAELTAQLSGLVRGWSEAVEAALAVGEEPGRAAAIAARYADAFPLGYRTACGPEEAALDIQRLRRLGTGEAAAQRDARLHCREGCAPGQLGLKLYQTQGAIPLSDAVPMLENFGFRVIGEVPTLLDGGSLGAIHDFQLELPAGHTAEGLLARAVEVEGAIAAVLNGAAEGDAFNRLIALGGLGARETMWLRAWYRYLRQAGMTYGIPTVVDALLGAPAVTRGLIALFLARHDPAQPGDRLAAEAGAAEAIRDGLAGVAAINDDRLLRQYRALVEAILRTNAFAPATGQGAVALAFKLDSALVPGLPRPVPWREIFVYDRRVEGIHLRAGPIARGGLRWSDRRDDFRTEVLGLMKAQRVKNAVIVPTGAKGGFYPKLLPDPSRDREGWAAEGKASYQIFVRSLLSLTDNIAGSAVVHPDAMVVRDGDDPYFVVAADKGTATFSDTANALAAERDFWLDDAFASGGSKGYDHKAMGITARGAWLSVQRHFLELGIDVQKDSVHVVGCGDMSGDVFGNGMLLSKAVRLVAAFDHRHVFLDPDPDPAKSWAERKRLFALPRSSWADYDARLISKGGGVYPRSQKEIPLSKQVRAVLGIDDARIDPDRLIQAILKAPVDLLWFGGIGTYVKAAAQNNIEVGDHANDALRVNGGQVRARVIGEGANLGCTQAGRIEYALAGGHGAGGRINTDFIDNSAGVDCSDNEVNIKIALASARRAGRLSEKARVDLLVSMTDAVARIVLEDNRLQALALSIAEAGGAPAMPSFIRLIETLEERGQLDRRTEGLAESEALARRAADGQGLTRPELAVLLSSAKLELKDALVLSTLPDDPGLGEEVLVSFPEAMRAKFRREILDHRLRREIVATEIANRIVNRLGLLHPFELAEEEGATLAQVAAAFVAAERLFAMDDVWQAIESGRMPEAARVALFDRAAWALRPHMADLLRAGVGPQSPVALAAALKPATDRLAEGLGDLIAAETRRQSGALQAELAAAGAPRALAQRVATLFDLDGVVGLARLAQGSGQPVNALATAFVDLGARLGLDWAQGMAARMAPSDPWERLLAGGLARDFQQMRLDFLLRASARAAPRKPAPDPEAAVAAWALEQAPAIRQFRTAVARAQGAVAVTPAMLAQLASQARSLLAR